MDEVRQSGQLPAAARGEQRWLLLLILLLFAAPLLVDLGGWVVRELGRR